MRVPFGAEDRWSEVKWPRRSGLVQRYADLPIDRYITLHEVPDQVG